jgi:hypothetical protein
MDLKFKEEGNFRKTSLINLRAPHAKNKRKDKTRNCCDQVKDVTDECKRRGREIMMGGDFNACVGTRNECAEVESQAIGPHGNKQQNMCGDMVIALATVGLSERSHVVLSPQPLLHVQRQQKRCEQTIGLLSDGRKTRLESD